MQGFRKHALQQQVYLNVEILPEGRVVDGSMVNNAQPVSFAALASPHLTGPRLCSPISNFSRIQRDNATSPTSQSVGTGERPGRARLRKLRNSERNALEFVKRRSYAQGKQQALRFGWMYLSFDLESPTVYSQAQLIMRKSSFSHANSSC